MAFAGVSQIPQIYDRSKFESLHVLGVAHVDPRRAPPAEQDLPDQRKDQVDEGQNSKNCHADVASVSTSKPEHVCFRNQVPGRP